MADMLTVRQREMGAKVLRALAHPVRLGVLQSLRGGERTVTQLYGELGCSQSLMSQQLAILEAHGLIRTRKEGTVKYCSLRNPDFLKLFSCLRNHLVNELHLAAEADCGPEARG